MNRREKLEFGIEIVAAMKASAYGVSIEDGRIMALENTEFNKEEYKKTGINEIPITEIEIESRQKYCRSEKKRLHKQAFFVADIALKKLEKENPLCINFSKESGFGCL